MSLFYLCLRNLRHRQDSLACVSSGHVRVSGQGRQEEVRCVQVLVWERSFAVCFLQEETESECVSFSLNFNLFSLEN